MSQIVRRAVYTKENGSSSDRVLVVPKSDNLLAVDVSALSDLDRNEVIKAIQEHQEEVKEISKKMVKSVDDRLKEKGIKVEWRSFNRSGLTFLD